jgi:hypothetical protein
MCGLAQSFRRTGQAFSLTPTGFYQAGKPELQHHGQFSRPQWTPSKGIERRGAISLKFACRVSSSVEE